jgi:radical SAM-linked protein
VESLTEALDVELTEPISEATLVATLNRVLPPGVKILEAHRLSRRQDPPGREGALYEVASRNPVFEVEAAVRFLAQGEFLVTRQRPKGDERVDLRRLVADLTVSDMLHVQLDLRRQEKGNVKVTDALAAIFALSDDQARELRIVKVKSI